MFYMADKFTRRDFLKMCALGVGALAFRPFFQPVEQSGFMKGLESGDVVRITTQSVSVYSEPNDKSKILFQRYRDELVNVYYEVNSEYGPGYNPLWYRVWGGYIHSAHTQRVSVRLNPVQNSFPEKGQLAEVTVPFTQSMLYNKIEGWKPLYRLYYESVHWVMAVESGPDGQPWYRIKDELFDVDPLDYFVPASHLRMIQPDELTPISPDVPLGKKRIEISIARQTLTAYEYDTVVLQTKIASGVPMPTPPPGQFSTDTPKGEFHVQNKMPSKHMGDGKLTSDLNAYELPGVPWVCFFEPKAGVATHGTYWHTNYGTPMSHGCVNMRTEEAKFIFRWTTPVYEPGNWDQKGYGTLILVS